MMWDRSETIGLAKQSCSFCEGIGQKPNMRERPMPCNCVLRAVFRACYARFRSCVNKEKFMSRVSLIPCKGGMERTRTFARLDEDYIADFCLVSRRALTPFDYEVFRNHFLLGADWRLCCRQMQIDRGTFFHALYRIQHKLGRIFREIRPYSLYPVDEYFAGRVRRKVRVIPIREPQRMSQPVQPPLRKIA